VCKQKLSAWHTGAYKTFCGMYVTTIFFNGMCVNHSDPDGLGVRKRIPNSFFHAARKERRAGWARRGLGGRVCVGRVGEKFSFLEETLSKLRFFGTS
jgi:hypothetical protein